MSLAQMLSTTISLERAIITKDSSGGQVQTYAAVSGQTDVPADIQPAGSSIRLQYAQRNLVVTHTVYVATDIGAIETDRIVSGTRYFVVMGYRKAAPGYDEWPSIADVEEQPSK